MVIKTQTCFFSELKIYPGHGTSSVRRDGKYLFFLNKKCASLNRQNKKAARLTWTQSWRRMNKKVKVEVVQKRKNKRKTRLQKAIGTMTVEEIRRRRAQRPARRAEREEAVKELKAKKKAAAEEKKKKAKKAAKGQPKNEKIKFSKKGRR